MGHSFSIQDTDVVQVHNITNQWFHEKHLGLTKLQAIQQEVALHNSNIAVTPIDKWFVKGDSIEEDIVITAVDSMECRKVIYTEAASNCKTKFLIDPRTGGETIVIHCVDLDNADSRQTYLDTLYSDAEANSETCSGASIIYTPAVAASLCTKLVKSILMGQPIYEMMHIDLSVEPFIQSIGKIDTTSKGITNE